MTNPKSADEMAPISLDELVEKDRQYRAKVAACSHEWGPPGIGSGDLGHKCTKCGVYELPWMRGRLAQLERVAEALKHNRASLRAFWALPRYATEADYEQANADIARTGDELNAALSALDAPKTP